MFNTVCVCGHEIEHHRFEERECSDPECFCIMYEPMTGCGEPVGGGNILSVNAVEDAIGVLRSDWPTNCYSVAVAMVKSGIVCGKARYGHWLGDVSEKSVFKPQPFHRHGWIEMTDGTIVDPTRYVFEGRDPYIYQGVSDYYDAGGNNLREAMESPPPQWDDSQNKFELTVSSNTAYFVMDLLDMGELGCNEVTVQQIFWLANLSLTTLSVFAREIFEFVETAGFKGFIPVDNFRLVKERS